jgi:BirA family biotin operon repressor/biotin-[acetyl-CoA-carboxylase] ligase
MNPIIGNQIIRIRSTESTNNYANHCMRLGSIDEGTVFLAYEQAAGRGQMNNTWESEPGKNLTFSIVLYPEFLEIRRQFLLSKVVSLGIYSAINKYVKELRIKWPNDIYAGEMKLAGILIENSIMGGVIKTSVIGIGLNVNQTIFVSDAPNPVSLQLLTNKHYDCEQVLREILAGINFYYQLLLQDETDQIDQEYISVLFRLNETHVFKTEDKAFSGKIVGVNEIGQLLIQNADGKILEFHFKEVEFQLKSQ